MYKPNSIGPEQPDQTPHQLRALRPYPCGAPVDAPLHLLTPLPHIPCPSAPPHNPPHSLSSSRALLMRLMLLTLTFTLPLHVFGIPDLYLPSPTHIAPQRLRVVAGAARLYPKLQSLSNEFSRATGIPIYFNFSSGLGTAGTTIRAAMAKAPPVDDTSDGSGGYDAFILGPAYLPQASWRDLLEPDT